MSYVWFNAVLAAIGKKINYESISNLYGNSFAKDASKYIEKANPFYVKVSHGPSMSLIRGKTTIIDLSKNANEDDSVAKSAINKAVGNISWALDFLKLNKSKGGKLNE